MPTRSDFELHYSQPQTQVEYRKTADDPMRILLMADLSGRANRGILEHGDGLARRPIVSLDVDNFDDVLFRYSPRLNVTVGRGTRTGVSLEFGNLDDFHPDTLYDKLELFRAFRHMRGRLADPKSFAEEADRLRRPLVEPPGEEPEESDTLTLERLLGKRSADAPQVRTVPGCAQAGIDEFIRSVIEPHVVPTAPSEQAELIRSVDQAAAEQMQALLHDPTFQALEAAWRSVHRLVTRLETGEELKLYLLDVSRTELVADIIAAQSDLSRSGLWRLLADAAAGGGGQRPWSLLVGDYTFGALSEDVSVLAGLGATASGAGGPFLAAADPSVLGCGGLDEWSDPAGWNPLDPASADRWQALRGSSVAAWLGLAAPRILLRLPHGGRTDPVERFEFEELGASHEHESLLWGNPAFACALLIGTAFQRRGWSMEPGDPLGVDDLPAYTFTQQGEAMLKPCAEVLFGQRAAEAILARGVMPVLSHRGANEVSLLRFQSLADPARPLAGPWA